MRFQFLALAFIAHANHLARVSRGHLVAGLTTGECWPVELLLLLVIAAFLGRFRLRCLSWHVAPMPLSPGPGRSLASGLVCSSVWCFPLAPWRPFGLHLCGYLAGWLIGTRLPSCSFHLWVVETFLVCWSALRCLSWHVAPISPQPQSLRWLMPGLEARLRFQLTPVYDATWSFGFHICGYLVDWPIGSRWPSLVSSSFGVVALWLSVRLRVRSWLLARPWPITGVGDLTAQGPRMRVLICTCRHGHPGRLTRVCLPLLAFKRASSFCSCL